MKLHMYLLTGVCTLALLTGLAGCRNQPQTTVPTTQMPTTMPATMPTTTPATRETTEMTTQETAPEAQETTAATDETVDNGNGPLENTDAPARSRR